MCNSKKHYITVGNHKLEYYSINIISHNVTISGLNDILRPYFTSNIGSFVEITSLEKLYKG